jgi:hypothetical protein
MCDDLGVINKRVHTAFTRVKLHETPRARMQQPLSDTRDLPDDGVSDPKHVHQRPETGPASPAPLTTSPETRDQRPETRD